MNRRTVLIGLGTAAVGSSLALGSGAFTQIESERRVTIRVDEDSQALVALEAGDPAVVQAIDGALTISTDDFGAFNEDATVEIGDTDSPDSTPAFTITNNFDDSIDLTLNIQGVDSDDAFTLHFDQNFDDGDSEPASNGKHTGTLDSDDSLDVAIEIDTGTSDLSGTLTISAEPTTQKELQ